MVCNSHLLGIRLETFYFMLALWSFSFAHVVRQSNAVVHVLTQRTRLYFPFAAWMELVPLNIDDFASADIHIVD